MLISQLDSVVGRYAPPAQGSYRAHGKYFTLNPGRADRHVGSFCVTMAGPNAGRWNDYAVGDVPGQGFGDVIDLIALSLGCSNADALREARAFLGLQTASAEDVARHKAAAERSKRLQEQAAQRDKEKRESRARAARAIWHSGQARLRDTPVDLYLRGRGSTSRVSAGSQASCATCRIVGITTRTATPVRSSRATSRRWWPRSPTGAA